MDSPGPTPVPLPPAELESLCRQASAGDEDALTRLLCHHHHRLLGFTIRKIGVDWQGKIDPEDILQEAYISVVGSIGSFTWQGEDSFYHWVARIIDHRFLDQVRALRRRKRDAAREVALDASRSSRHGAMLDRLLPDFSTASRAMRREDAVAAMLMCIAKLPEDYRRAVERIYLNEEPIKDVAREMDRTEDALRRLVGRALERLAACMGRASRYISGAG